MSSKFRPLAEGFYVSPQITADDVRAAAQMGVKLIVNNRPDHEEPGQPSGLDIESEAKAQGVGYVAIPVQGGNVAEADLDRFDEAVSQAQGPVLAYCRSGTRSTLVRALSRARSGDSAEAILAEAKNAGYDLSQLRPRLVSLGAAG